MKNLFKTSLLVFFMVISMHVFSQGKIKFEKIAHDFGTIKEVDGPAEVTFEFTNTGDKPLKLTNVKASCGCTTPKWSKDAVAPGKTGVVVASYNPKNRPGKFNKTITITTDGEPPQARVSIKGEVIPRKKGVKDWYATELGNLRMKSSNIYLNKIYHNEKASQTVLFYNQGEKAIVVKLDESLKTLKHVQVTPAVLTIQPKDSSKFKITYDAEKKNDWGYNSDRITLLTDDEKQPKKNMYISANITENFGDITSESKLPIVRYDKLKHDFGKINQNTRNTVDFKITNAGQAPLFIRKTKASCGCTAGNPAKTKLAPNESTIVSVTYSSGKKKGKQRQYVTVITNDPARTETRLSVEAEVMVHEKEEAPKK